jgi:hypothetical protein
VWELEKDLAHRLVAAMRAVTEEQVPDSFILVTHPEHATLLADNPSILIELSALIQEAGEQSDIELEYPPTISVRPDMDIGPGEIRILAQVRQNKLGDTTGMPLKDEDQVDESPANAFLILGGAEIFPLNQAVINIGRRPGNHLEIDDQRISREHAQLRAMQDNYMIFDLDSTGGTFVNGKRVTQRILAPGDVISLAGISIIYGMEGNTSLGQTQEHIITTPSDMENSSQTDSIFPEKQA